MKLVTMTRYFSTQFGMEKAVDLLSEAGFDGLDFTAYHTSEFYTDVHSKAYYEEIRKRAEARGVPFEQAHAPYHGSYHGDDPRTEQQILEIVCSMKNASYLGIKNVVVHPIQHYRYRLPGMPERLFEENIVFYRRLLSYAEEYGIRVCVENMCQGDMDILNVPSVCARPAEMIRYFDEINHPLFGCCLDIGHATLVREDTAAFIRALGKKRLTCLHVHDVDAAHDRHLPPYFGGAVNWDRVLSALAEIDYEGSFTYEADYFFGQKPPALATAAARLIAAIGHTLTRRFEEQVAKKDLPQSRA